MVHYWWIDLRMVPKLMSCEAINVHSFTICELSLRLIGGSCQSGCFAIWCDNLSRDDWGQKSLVKDTLPWDGFMRLIHKGPSSIGPALALK